MPRSNDVIVQAPRTDTGARRHAILVLGMHRSGTSALVRLLGFLGADLPKHLMESSFANSIGYSEPADIVAIHDDMLTAAGSAWDDAAEFPLDWLDTPAAQPFRARLREAFEEGFGASSLALLKDPRICRFVPLWISILESMGIEPLFVILVRSPLEVAASLRVREETAATPLLAQDRMPEAKALLLWLRHFLDAERHTRGFPRSFVGYEQLLGDWRGAVAKIGRDLGVDWPGSAEEAAPQAEGFLSRELRHHVSADDILAARPNTVPWLKEAFRWAQNATVGRLEGTGVLDRIHAALRLADLAPKAVDEASPAEQTRAAAAALEQQIAERTDALAERLGGEPLTTRQELRPLIVDIANHFGQANQTLAHALGVAGVVHADLARRLKETSAQVAALLAEREAHGRQLEEMRAAAAELEKMRAAAAELAQRSREAADLADEVRGLRGELGEAVMQRDAMRQLFRQQSKIIATLRMDQLAKVRLQETVTELESRNLDLERRNSDLVQECSALQRLNSDLAEKSSTLEQRSTEFEERSHFFEQQCELFHARNLKIARFVRHVPAPLRYILKRLVLRSGSTA
jgi:hypothetical protein